MPGDIVDTRTFQLDCHVVPRHLRLSESQVTHHEVSRPINVPDPEVAEVSSFPKDLIRGVEQMMFLRIPSAVTNI